MNTWTRSHHQSAVGIGYGDIEHQVLGTGVGRMCTAAIAGRSRRGGRRKQR